MPLLVVYDKSQALALVQTWSPSQLHTALGEQTFGDTLLPAERAALLHLVHEWMVRALGAVMLRDALLVDPQRGQQVYHLLCRALTREQQQVSPAMHRWLAPLQGQSLTLQHIRTILHKIGRESARNNATIHAEWAKLAMVLQQAAEAGWDVVCCEDAAQQGAFPYPTDLEDLLPPLPLPYEMHKSSSFAQIGWLGWRHILALILVVVGLVLLRWMYRRGGTCNTSHASSFMPTSKGAIY
jgi:hypothetical protein